MIPPPPLLLAGSTGYVGGHLLRSLEDKKILVRCLAGEVLKAPSLKKALTGIHTAFYLVDPMGNRKDHRNAGLQPAKNFAHACAVAKVQRIIYLGGYARPQVGEALLASGVPVLEFRASIILGPGSLSFEMLRAIVESGPVIVTPRWVHTMAQPIGIEDVIAYLLEALKYRGPSRVFEIGGPEPVSYGELMKEYARQRGLRRWMVSVPIRARRLSSAWLGHIAPRFARVNWQLIERLCAPSVVSHPQALSLFRVRPQSYPDVISQALRN